MIEPRLQFDVVDDEMAAIFRGMTESERLAVAHRMWRSAMHMIQSMLRSENPHWSSDQIQRETARRMSHGAV